MAKLSRRTSVGVGLLLLLFGVLMLIRIFVELSAGVYVLLAAAGLFFAFAVRKKSVFLILGWICVAVGLLLNFEFYVGDLVQDALPAVAWLSFAIAALGLHISGSQRVGNWPLILGGILLFCGIYSMIWAIPELVSWWKRMGIFVLPVLLILTGLIFLVLAIRGAGRRERRMEEAAKVEKGTEKGTGTDGAGEKGGDGKNANDVRDSGAAREEDAETRLVKEPPLEGQIRMDLDAETGEAASGAGSVAPAGAGSAAALEGAGVASENTPGDSMDGSSLADDAMEPKEKAHLRADADTPESIKDEHETDGAARKTGGASM